MTEGPARRRASPSRPRQKAGPTDIADPLFRAEARRAFAWLGVASLFALTVILSQPLLVIFAGMVFAAMVDGGARMLGRILPIARGWRVGIVLTLTAAFLGWVGNPWSTSDAPSCAM